MIVCMGYLFICNCLVRKLKSFRASDITGANSKTSELQSALHTVEALCSTKTTNSAGGWRMEKKCLAFLRILLKLIDL